MDRWHLPSIDVTGKREPRVLFSRPACRAVIIDLQPDEELREHSVHENAVVHVVSGSVTVAADGQDVSCLSGTMLVFAPGERHSLRADSPARLLLVLAPWPGDGHYLPGEDAHPEQLPQHAHVPPLA